MSDTSRLARKKREGAEASLAELEGLLVRSLEDSGYRGMTWHKFAARSVDCAAALRRACDAGNLVELAREAHTLKGVASSLAAKDLRELAAELERAAGRGDLQHAREAVERVCAQIERSVEAVRFPRPARG
jgi:hypothetical protein